MIPASSWAEAINTYVVESLAHSLVALAIISGVLRFGRIHSPVLRIKLFLVPLLLPIISPFLYYALIPHRRYLPVLPIDKILDGEKALSLMPWQWHLEWPILVAGATLAALLAAYGLVPMMATLVIAKRHRPLAPSEEPRLERALAPLLQRSGLPRPRLLLSPEEAPICCAFSLRQSHLIVSQGLLDLLDDEHLEAALAHELGHIREGHGGLRLGLVVLRSLLFFNPMAHWLRLAILEEAELAADRRALAWGTKPIILAESLLQVVRASPRALALRPLHNSFAWRRSLLRRRIEHALEGAVTLATPGRWLLPGATVAVIVVLVFVC